MKNEIIKIAKDLEQGTVTTEQARTLLLGLFDVSGSFLEAELNWLAENAAMDFLGTGSDCKAAEREEKEWWNRFNNIINVVKNYR